MRVAYTLNGVGSPYFAGWTPHCSLDPASDALVEAFAKEVAPYERCTGTLKFPGLLYEVQPNDVQTFVVVTVVLTGTALLAWYAPALAIARIAPTIALRRE